MFLISVIYLLYALPVRWHIMRSKLIDYKQLKQLANYLYHYTEINNLENIFNNSHEIELKGYFNFDNIVLKYFTFRKTLKTSLFLC